MTLRKLQAGCITPALTRKHHTCARWSSLPELQAEQAPGDLVHPRVLTPLCSSAGCRLWLQKAGRAGQSQGVAVPSENTGSTGTAVPEAAQVPKCVPRPWDCMGERRGRASRAILVPKPGGSPVRAHTVSWDQPPGPVCSQ